MSPTQYSTTLLSQRRDTYMELELNPYLELMTNTVAPVSMTSDTEVELIVCDQSDMESVFVMRYTV